MHYTSDMATLVQLAAPPAVDPSTIAAKQELLFTLLRDMDEVMVAYSGGIDSAYLMWAANEVLGAKAVAVTADSASLPESHKRDAEEFARDSGFRHEYIFTNEFDNPDYVKNDINRCFHCKDELFTQLDALGEQRNVPHIIYGVNMDDLGDYRPGQRAAKLHNVKAPLVEAGLYKGEIRELARLAGLKVWDRPASACLSSRVPYGTAVTPGVVKTVEIGEEAVKALGFRQFRVRFHGELVRLEIDRAELARALTMEMAEQFTAIFKPLGFHFVTIDLEGYRQGSMNAGVAVHPNY